MEVRVSIPALKNFPSEMLVPEGDYELHEHKRIKGLRKSVTIIEYRPHNLDLDSAFTSFKPIQFPGLPPIEIEFSILASNPPEAFEKFKECVNLAFSKVKKIMNSQILAAQDIPPEVLAQLKSEMKSENKKKAGGKSGLLLPPGY